MAATHASLPGARFEQRCLRRAGVWTPRANRRASSTSNLVPGPAVADRGCELGHPRVPGRRAHPFAPPWLSNTVSATAFAKSAAMSSVEAMLLSSADWSKRRMCTAHSTISPLPPKASLPSPERVIGTQPR